MFIGVNRVFLRVCYVQVFFPCTCGFVRAVRTKHWYMLVPFWHSGTNRVLVKCW